MTIRRLARVWARAVLAVAGLLAAAEALLFAERRDVHARVALLERLVERLRAENESSATGSRGLLRPVALGTRPGSA